MRENRDLTADARQKRSRSGQSSVTEDLPVLEGLFPDSSLPDESPPGHRAGDQSDSFLEDSASYADLLTGHGCPRTALLLEAKRSALQALWQSLENLMPARVLS